MLHQCSIPRVLLKQLPEATEKLTWNGPVSTVINTGAVRQVGQSDEAALGALAKQCVIGREARAVRAAGNVSMGEVSKCVAGQFGLCHRATSALRP